MTGARAGLFFAFLFVLIEALQTVYFGGLFQQVNVFFYGALTFGVMSLGIIMWTAVTSGAELRAAWAMPRDLILINIGAALTFTSFLISVQLIEPAITYTVSSAMMPVTALLLAGWASAGTPGKRASVVVLAIAVIVLSLATLTGGSGFARGGVLMAAVGLALAMTDGIFFTLILAGSARLNAGGTGPLAVLGLRMPLYVVVSAGFAAVTLTPAGTPAAGAMAGYVLLGLILTAPPLYFLQKAVPLLTTFALSAITALGPLFIFGLQVLEGRVSFSALTLGGVLLYVMGALLAAQAAVKEARVS